MISPYWNIYDCIRPRLPFKKRLSNTYCRFKKPTDQTIAGTQLDMAPKGMDQYQAHAWASPYKHTIVEAGAGAGKTFLVIERAKLLLEKGARPEEIAFITFTRAATGELKKRLSARLGQDIAARMNVSTIHSFSCNVAKNLGLPSTFRIYNKRWPNDPYRLAWKTAVLNSVKAKGGAYVTALLQSWLIKRNFSKEGLRFEYIYPELHGDPR